MVEFGCSFFDRSLSKTGSQSSAFSFMDWHWVCRHIRGSSQTRFVKDLMKGRHDVMTPPASSVAGGRPPRGEPTDTNGEKNATQNTIRREPYIENENQRIQRSKSETGRSKVVSTNFDAEPAHGLRPCRWAWWARRRSADTSRYIECVGGHTLSRVWRGYRKST